MPAEPFDTLYEVQSMAFDDMLAHAQTLADTEPDDTEFADGTKQLEEEERRKPVRSKRTEPTQQEAAADAPLSTIVLEEAQLSTPFLCNEKQPSCCRSFPDSALGNRRYWQQPDA